MDTEMQQNEDRRDQLAQTRETHQHSLERFFAMINDEETFQFLTSSALRVYQERINRQFELFEQADSEYRRSCVLITEQVFNEVECQYMAVMTRIHDRLTEQNSFEHISTPIAASQPEWTMPTVIKVETTREPQIGKFNGNAADWPAFRDLFLAEVHNKALDPVTKLLYLQGACIDKAAATLGPWNPTSDNYVSAWETLKNVYEDNYHVIHGILGRMYAVKKHERESHDALRAIVDALNSGTRQMEAIASPEALWDQMWIHYGKQRLPKYTLDAWEQYRNRDGTITLPKLTEFKRFLEVKAKGRREFETEDTFNKSEQISNTGQNSQNRFNRDQRARNENRRGHDSRFQPYERNERSFPRKPFLPQNKPAQNNNTERALVEPNRCPMEGCLRIHPVFLCDIFKKASLEERLKVVQVQRLCRCCLKAGHNAASCTYDPCSQCPDDPYKHHFRLCKKAKQNYGGDKPATSGNPFARQPVAGAQ